MNEELIRNTLFEAGLSVKEQEEIVCLEEDSPGLGYSSLLQRFKISTSDKDSSNKNMLSVILKTNPDVAHPPDSLFDKMFDCEIKMYQKILPIFKELFERSCNSIVWPTFYTISKDGNIVMEDLKPEFRNNVEEFGSTLEEAYLAINSLAQFHAASLVAKEEGKIECDTLEPYFYCRNDITNNQFFEDSLKILVKVMKLLGQKYQSKVIEKLEEYSQTIGNYLEKLHLETDDKLKVINHGDFWRANLMFKYDTKDPINFKFVDFQLSHYGSLAWDLAYFFFLNPNRDLLYIHYDQLLRSYQISMEDFVKRCRSNACIPSLAEIHKEVERFLTYGFLKSCTDLPYQICSVEGGVNAENLFQSNEEAEKLKIKLFLSKTYQQIIESHIEFLSNKNVL